MITQLLATTPQVSIGPETIFHLGPLPITNSLILGSIGYVLVLVGLIATAVMLRRNSRSKFMHAILWVFEMLYDTVLEVIGDKRVARRVAPLAITLFFFFVLNNWLGILPIVGSVKYHGEPLFRGAAADLNTTIALAIISMTTAQIWALKTHGFFGNLGRYFKNPFKDPVHAFEGILELMAEFSRTTALAMRIFGNVFGGEVLLSVIGFLTSWAAPIALPVFYVLELFVGTVQAYVFYMLTIAFISIALPSSEDDHSTDDAPNEQIPDAAPTELSGNRAG
jgi:F-type H+-transporting ATPase subunit a